MEINQMLAELKNTKLYYDASLAKCKSQGQIILLSIRKKYRWTQKQMAEHLGCSTTYVTLIETGTHSISGPILFSLAEIIEELEGIDRATQE